MKSKKLVLWALVAVLVVAVAIPVFGGRRSGPAGKSDVAKLYLVEKDPNTWEPIDGGAWGKMIYSSSGSMLRLVFNGHDLVVGEDYTLIYYPDPWPGNGLICLGTGTADEEGNVHIKANVDTGDIPTEADENYPDGAKIWLVLSSDVDCEGQSMVGWNPTEYLFEQELITFDDTDD